MMDWYWIMLVWIQGALVGAWVVWGVSKGYFLLSFRTLCRRSEPKLEELPPIKFPNVAERHNYYHVMPGCRYCNLQPIDFEVVQ